MGAEGICGLVGAASVLALAYYLSIRKHRTSTRDADPEGKYDASADGSANVRSTDTLRFLRRCDA